MRRFELIRDQDATGISGTGLVAEGMEWPDGHVALRWGQDIHSTVLYSDVEDVVKIHGHGGKTRLVWLDPQQDQSHRDAKLLPLCVICFGGPYTDRGDHCIDCGASGCVVYLPAWGVEEIRRHDRQRLDSLGHCIAELQMLRARLPIPDNFAVEPNTSSPPQDPPLWNVKVTNDNRTTSTCITAPSSAEALRKGANCLSWMLEPRP